MKGLTTQELKLLLRSVGTHRGDRPLSPLEVGQLLKKSVGAGSTRKELASALSIGTTQVSSFLKLPDLASDIRHLADWGSATQASVSFSSLAELGRLSESDQVEAAGAILSYKLTWKEVVQLVQIATRSGKAMGSCIQEVLRLRPQVERRYLYVGAITNENLEHLLDTMTQKQRDDLLERALLELVSTTDLVSGRLGSKNFTLLSSANLFELLSIKPDNLEDQLNRQLVEASQSI